MNATERTKAAKTLAAYRGAALTPEETAELDQALGWATIESVVSAIRQAAEETGRAYLGAVVMKHAFARKETAQREQAEREAEKRRVAPPRDPRAPLQSTFGTLIPADAPTIAYLEWLSIKAAWSPKREQLEKFVAHYVEAGVVSPSDALALLDAVYTSEADGPERARRGKAAMDGIYGDLGERGKRPARECVASARAAEAEMIHWTEREPGEDA